MTKIQNSKRYDLKKKHLCLDHWVLKFEIYL